MYVGHRLLRTQFLPLFVQRCWRKVGITFGRLMRFSRCVSRKRKIPPMQHSDGFCRVKQRQNESGVLRGGKFFCGLSLTEVVGLTVITNHFLWLCSKWTRPHLVDEFEPIHKISGTFGNNSIFSARCQHFRRMNTWNRQNIHSTSGKQHCVLEKLLILAGQSYFHGKSPIAYNHCTIDSSLNWMERSYLIKQE